MIEVPDETVNYWHRRRAIVLIKFEQAMWWVKNKLLPSIWRFTKNALIGTFIGTVGALTVLGLDEPLRDGAYSELLSVSLGTTGTVIAIFFSLVLIPINQISGRYAPRFFEHLKNDTVFFTTFFYAFLSISYSAFFLYRGANDLIAFSVVLQIAFLFIILYSLWLYSIFLSNPVNGVLLREQKTINKTIKKQIRVTTRRRIRSMTANSITTYSRATELSYFNVDETVTDYLQARLLSFREVAMKALKNGEIEQAKNAIGSMTAIVLNYLKQRKDYTSDDDPTMYFLYTEFKLLAETSSSYELKIKIHPFIAECWNGIGLATTRVNVKGLQRMNNSTNSLAYYPVKALEELFLQNLKDSDSTTPGVASKALGDVGVNLISKGYEHQAQQIIDKLATLSKVANKLDINIFSSTSNNALVRIYAMGLINRNDASDDMNDYVYGEINENIQGLLKEILSKKPDVISNQGFLNSLIGWLEDPINGLNFSRVAEFAIFTPELTEQSLKENMNEVKNILGHIKYAINRLEELEDSYFIEQAYENIYRIYLILASYLNEEMAPSHILSYQSQPVINVELKQDAEILIVDIIEYLFSKVERRSGIRRFNVLGVLTSVYLIAFYESVVSKNDSTTELFNTIHLSFVNVLTIHTKGGLSNENSDFCKHARLIQNSLRKRKYYKKAKELNIPDFNFSTMGEMALFESEYPKDFLSGRWRVTRPLVQKNGYYFNDVDEFILNG